jgi:membrane fusion protein (multidrug efflux system)
MKIQILKFSHCRKSAILLSLAGASVMFGACSSEKKENKTTENFQVTRPIVADTSVVKDYVAEIQALQNVELRSRVKGYLDRINVDEGKFVKQGQVLFVISNQEYKEELSKATAELKSAVADVKTSELELQNVKTLVEQKVVSKTELDLAQAKLDALRAKADEAAANESAAKLNLSYTTIKAPFDGIINRIPNKVGSLIDEGMLMTTLSNTKEVYAYFNVSEEEYLGYVKDNELGNQKEVSLVLADNQPYPYKGVIETVEGEINKSTGNIAFRARFQNPEQLLKHGASGKIQISKTIKNALLIPQKSTVDIQEKTFVYLLDKNNQVQMRSINPQVRLADYYIISNSDLDRNDQFVYEGIQQIKEGEKINPQFIKLRGATEPQEKLLGEELVNKSGNSAKI